jgi:hypothetical protein
MILTMHNLPQLPGALQLAGNLIGKTIFVNWPMMHEAKVSLLLLNDDYLVYFLMSQHIRDTSF